MNVDFIRNKEFRSRNSRLRRSHRDICLVRRSAQPPSPNLLPRILPIDHRQDHNRQHRIQSQQYRCRACDLIPQGAQVEHAKRRPDLEQLIRQESQQTGNRRAVDICQE